MMNTAKHSASPSLPLTNDRVVDEAAASIGSGDGHEHDLFELLVVVAARYGEVAGLPEREVLLALAENLIV